MEYSAYKGMTVGLLMWGGVTHITGSITMLLIHQIFHFVMCV